MKFNGMSKIEIEMLVDELNKMLPLMLATTGTAVELTMKYYQEYKSKGLSEKEARNFAVKSAFTHMGFN